MASKRSRTVTATAPRRHRPDLPGPAVPYGPRVEPTPSSSGRARTGSSPRTCSPTPAGGCSCSRPSPSRAARCAAPSSPIPASCTTSSARSTHSASPRRSCTALDLSGARAALATGAARARASRPPTAAARCCRRRSARPRSRSRSTRRGDGDAWRDCYASYERIADPLLDAMTQPIPPVRGATRLAAALGPRGLLDFSRLALLSVRRLAARTVRGEGGALLLAGNALHSDVDPSAPPSGFLGWFLTCLGQQHGFPVPEGGAGQLTAALVRRLECTRRRDPLLVAGHARRRPRPPRGRGRARRRRRRSTRRAASLADVERAGALPRPRRRRAPARRGSCARSIGSSGTTARSRSTGRSSGPIPWRAEPATRAGTVHLCDSMDRVSAYAADLARGQIPAHPFVLHRAR